MASGPAERARLLGLVRDFILARGVVELSLSELSRGIGSNNRMLLYHFGSLDKILAAAIDEVLDGDLLISRLTELLHSRSSSAGRVTAAWRHISDPERLPHLRLFFARFGMASDSPQRYADFLVRTREEWTDIVAAALGDDEEIPDPLGTAVAIVGLWRGLQVLLISGEPQKAVDEIHDRSIAALLRPLI
ncbi:MAG TPA: hypothetical protein VH008_28605 [Pseudonocardia sp.]|nr:hypothetical protein [Pseudonocardia sp.]